MEPKNPENIDLIPDDQYVACGRCGKYNDRVTMELDEEEGIFLCPMCLAEGVSCGCSDE